MICGEGYDGKRGNRGSQPKTRDAGTSSIIDNGIQEVLPGLGGKGSPKWKKK